MDGCNVLGQPSKATRRATLWARACAFWAANGGTQQDIAIASGPFASNYMGSSGIPHWNWTRPMQKGDLVHCDQWGPVDGYYTDFARSTVVGGKPNDGQRELLEGSVAPIHHIIAGIKPGSTTSGTFIAAVRNGWMITALQTTNPRPMRRTPSALTSHASAIRSGSALMVLG